MELVTVLSTSVSEACDLPYDTVVRWLRRLQCTVKVLCVVVIDYFYMKNKRGNLQMI